MLTFNTIKPLVKKVSTETSFIKKVLKPETTIKLDDLVKIKLDKFLEDLKSAGVKISEKYTPKTDSFIRNEASVVRTQSGSTIVHLPSINKGIEETIPYNMSIKFDKSGNPLQLVGVGKSEQVTFANILRTESGAKALETEERLVNTYQTTIIDKEVGERTIERSLKGTDFYGTPVETPSGYTLKSTSKLNANEPDFIDEIYGDIDLSKLNPFDN